MEMPKEFENKKQDFSFMQTTTEVSIVDQAKINEALVGLDDDEVSLVLDFSKKIDINDSELAISYGIEAQKKLDTFSDQVLTEARTKDLGKTGELISSVVTELSDFSSPNQKGLKGLFRKGENYVKSLKVKYESVEKSVDRISTELKEQQMILMKDHTILENLYEENKTYFRKLSLYIAAGRVALEEAKVEKERLAREARELGTQEAAQAYSDFVAKLERFEKKLLDLDTTRIISIQMAPQIRMLQSNNFSLIEKIQSTIVNTIPLWKSQLVITLGTQASLQAASMQKKVSDFTNKMLKENADALRMASVETAKELQRGIVDMDTLKYTNKQLMDTLTEVMQIQAKGREERIQTQKELRGLESELKSKILALATASETESKTILPQSSSIKLELK